jgi:acyl-CoA thioesterase FadM
LEVRGNVKQIKGRKVVMSASVIIEGEICARGEVVAVRMPEDMKPEGMI